MNGLGYEKMENYYLTNLNDLLLCMKKAINFIDPEIKKKFEERIKNAIKFKERISKAEELTNKIIDDFNKKELKHRSKSKKKQLESIPEEENKNEEMEENEKKNKQNEHNEFVNKINEIKLEDSDDED